MNVLQKLASTLFISLFVFFSACTKDDSSPATGELLLTFLHEVNGKPLVLNEQAFTNAAGNVYRVEKLKYYVSNIELTKTDGSAVKIKDGYFLIEQTSLDSRLSISLPNIPLAAYSSLSFAIGVDSSRNFSTEMVGDLNPNNDMAWNWVSGYKFLMLEGKFTTQTQATGAIVYHIGGNSSLRRVSLSAPAGGMRVNDNQLTELGIGADVNRLFDTQHTIDLNNLNAIMQPGDDANQIADNYAAGMFSLHHIHIK
jgi:hypothetical protein